MISHLTSFLTLVLSAYVLYLIIHNSFGNQTEGFQDPPKYDPNDPSLYDKPVSPESDLPGYNSKKIALRKPIESKINHIGGTSNPSRPYDLKGRSILKKDLDLENKYLAKEKVDLGGFNFLYPKTHSQVDTVSLHTKNRKVQMRTEPPNPRLDMDPWSYKKLNPDWHKNRKE